MDKHTDDVSEVSRQVNKLILPFAFLRPYDDTVIAAAQVGWTPKEFENERLFSHVNDLVSVQQSPGTIGRCFSLQSRDRVSYGLPQNYSTPLHFEVKGQINAFMIEGVDLFLFETQTGFIVLDLAYDPTVSVEEIISMNYFLRKIGSHGPSISYEVRRSSDVQTVTCTLLDIIVKLVGTFQAELAADDSRGTSFHSHYFGSILLDRGIRDHPNWQANIRRWLLLMRRGYKDSYKPAQGELDDSSGFEVMQLFENTHWGVALEGIANLAVLTGDKETDSFFLSNYFGNVKHTYFYLYVLALHQRYALLFLTRQAAMVQAPMVRSAPRSIKEYDRDELLRLQEHMAIFSLRCRFNQVSNNSIHEKLYGRIVSVLELVELQHELQNELSSISLLIELRIQEEQQRQVIAEREKEKREERIKGEKEARERRFHIVVLILTTVFVVITSSADLWDMFMHFQEGRIPHDRGSQLLLLGLLGMLWISVAGLFISYLRMRKSQHSLSSVKRVTEHDISE